MADRIAAKVGTYEQDGQTKGRWVTIGHRVKNQDGGQYLLLDPSVNLAGVLLQQNVEAQRQGKDAHDRVMCSIFSDDRQQRGSTHGGPPAQPSHNPPPDDGYGDYVP